MYLLYLGLFIVLTVLYGLWTNRQIDEDIFTMGPPKNSPLTGLTIVQISDLHFRRLRVPQKKLLQAVASQEPDVIVVTGDTIDRTENLATTKIKQFINDLALIAPTYIIEGNHEETCSDLNQWRQMMQDSNGILLENEVVPFLYKEHHIGMVGLRNGITDLPAGEKFKLQDYTASLLLVHHPEFYDTYLDNFKDTSIQIMFTGHAHGGQIRLPFIGGILGPDNTWMPKYTSGLYFKNDETNIPLIVSRGLGNSRFPIRINNKPHIVTVKYKTN